MIRPRQGAFALLTVLVLISIGLAVLAGVLSWTSTNSRNSQRHTVYMASMGVTDSVLERAISKMVQDYQANDQTYVASHLSDYRTISSGTNESALFSSFRFYDLSGASNRINVTEITNWGFGGLMTKYAGINGYSVTYRFAVSGLNTTSDQRVPVTLQQDVQLASIPVFGFGAFYNLDLEICPSGTYAVSGRTHCNANVYVEPTGTLTFSKALTASGTINKSNSTNDPTSRSLGTINWPADMEAGVATLALPVGTNNSPDALRQLVEIPPVSESTNTPMGRMRFYNRADLIILVTSNGVSAMSGVYNGSITPVNNLQSTSILRTNVSMYDQRENLWIEITELDISRLITQYTSLSNTLTRAVKTIYFADQRPMDLWTIPGLRIVNGSTLPSAGLTVATPHPLYVLSHFNAPTAYRGTTNTTTAAPAALVADAVTILSSNWRDNNSSGGMGGRRAVSTTLNAAIIAGTVPSDGNNYSGGVENFLRLLEDWNGDTLTCNGSMVCLFDSRQATGPWGASSSVYKTPSTRQIAWDSKYGGTNLPPSTPFLSTAFKSKWVTLSSTNVF